MIKIRCDESVCINDGSHLTTWRVGSRGSVSRRVNLHCRLACRVINREPGIAQCVGHGGLPSQWVVAKAGAVAESIDGGQSLTNRVVDGDGFVATGIHDRSHSTCRITGVSREVAELVFGSEDSPGSVVVVGHPVAQWIFARDLVPHVVVMVGVHEAKRRCDAGHILKPTVSCGGAKTKWRDSRNGKTAIEDSGMQSP